jgi:hypothetical protein
MTAEPHHQHTCLTEIPDTVYNPGDLSIPALWDQTDIAFLIVQRHYLIEILEPDFVNRKQPIQSISVCMQGPGVDRIGS